MKRRWLGFDRLGVRCAGLCALLALLLLMLGAGTAAADPAGASPAEVGAGSGTSTPACRECHAEEYEEWTGTTHAAATLDPLFQKQMAMTQNPAACLPCHTTGYDPATGTAEAEGVTCEACHSPYTADHPAAAGMDLPRASDTCGKCHRPTYWQWQASEHAANDIECFDCHKAHTQELRLETEKLCTACHDDEQTHFAHAAHQIEGTGCAGCHIEDAIRESCTTGGMEVLVSTHDFDVSSDVCSRCHESAVHATAPSGSAAATVGLALDRYQAEADRVPELESRNTDLLERLRSLQNFAVGGIGLALGVGGFVGLLIGIVGMSLKRKEDSE